MLKPMWMMFAWRNAAVMSLHQPPLCTSYASSQSFW